MNTRTKPVTDPTRPDPPTMGDVVAWIPTQPDPALSRSRLPPDTPADVLGGLTAAWWAIRTPDGAPAPGYECEGPGCPLPTATTVARFCSRACRERAAYTPQHTTRSVVCEICGTRFVARRTTARYCGGTCRNRAHKTRKGTTR
jgi:hypothetical protein